jgi:four helix bundle protein
MDAHRDLEVWRRSHALAIRVYRITAGAEFDGSAFAVDQVRRSTESIPDNIAEGRAARTDPVYLRHIGIAFASAGEAASQFVRLRDKGRFTPELAFELLDELAIVQRQLLALEASVKRRRDRPRPRKPRSRRGG